LGKEEMTIVLLIMMAILLIPIYEGARNENVWERMLAFASIATKTSVMILVISVIRKDWSIGVVGVLILSLGNAALMLLAHILRRLDQADNL
jgi:multicomponent Na+:H+ antiporter subunit F